MVVWCWGHLVLRESRFPGGNGRQKSKSKCGLGFVVPTLCRCGEGWGTRTRRWLQNVDSEQPPDQEDCYKGSDDVAGPLAGCAGSAESEHAGMIAVRPGSEACLSGSSFSGA